VNVPVIVAFGVQNNVRVAVVEIAELLFWNNFEIEFLNLKVCNYARILLALIRQISNPRFRPASLNLGSTEGMLKI
jgi:hypothetical protein